MALQWSEYLLLVSLLIFQGAQGDSTDSKIVAARVESCRGCRLNRLPDVKKFVFEDVPLYENVDFKHIQGASPELVLLNTEDEELERIDLAPLSREDCNNLLIKRGFRRKGSEEDESAFAQHEEF